MTVSLLSLPISGDIERDDPVQSTYEDLAAVLDPLLNHPLIAEFGWYQCHLPIESEPEHWDVRRIWVRTVHDTGRPIETLGVFAGSHPTLGHVLHHMVPSPRQLPVWKDYVERENIPFYKQQSMLANGGAAEVIKELTGEDLELDEEMGLACKAAWSLHERFRDSTFRDVLIEKFGTSGWVTVSRDGITVTQMDWENNPGDWR